MQYVKNPNLPENKVKVAIVDNRIGEYADKLRDLGVELIFTKTVDYLDDAVSSHPDMQICHLGNEKFCALGSVAEYYVREISKYGSIAHCEKINKREGFACKLEYPRDCSTNVALTSTWAIGLKGNVILEELRQNKIYTRQGYSKCSTVIVADGAIITADESIAKSAGNFGIDVCIVSNNAIRLRGYKNGFIGGCAGKISKDKLVFYGSLEKYEHGDKIKTFCEKYDVECISLGRGPLEDYGSFLPIFEKSDV